MQLYPLPRPGNRHVSLSTYNLPPCAGQCFVLLHVVLGFNEDYKTSAGSAERRIINPPCEMGTGICLGSQEVSPWESRGIIESVDPAALT